MRDIEVAASGVLAKDARQQRGFSERRSERWPSSLRWSEAGILSGQITEETRDFFLDSLEDMARNFSRTLRGLVTITIEKVWHAVVGVI